MVLWFGRGLDLSEFVVGHTPNINTDSTDDLCTASSTERKDQKWVYDLYAVSNHYGGLSGGHYTAYAKNFKDLNWYQYDDSWVRKIEIEEVIVFPHLPLLFFIFGFGVVYSLEMPTCSSIRGARIYNKEFIKSIITTKFQYLKKQL